jgi:hypothetical protein
MNMRRGPSVAAATVALLVALAAVAATAAFVHPGVLVSPSQLAWMQQAALDPAGHPTAAGAYKQALNGRYGNTSYVPLGPPATRNIDCGPYSKPDHGCSAEDHDAATAYTQMLLFAINGDTAHARAATRILDTYTDGLAQYTNANAPLQAAWGLSKWTRAAELARHLPNVGWPAERADAFTAMLYRAALPLVYGGSKLNGNWELSMLEGMLGLAVLSENATLYKHALSMFDARLASAFYNFDADGAQPRPAPRGRPSWYGQTVFDAATSGVAQETCRDLGHTSYALAAASNFLETARAQEELVAPETRNRTKVMRLTQSHESPTSASAVNGNDDGAYANAAAATGSVPAGALWSRHAKRMRAAAEFNAALLVLPDGNATRDDLCGGAPTKTAPGPVKMPTFEVVHHALADRLGLPMPSTLLHLQQSVRVFTHDRSGVDGHMMVFESLTHSGGPGASSGRGGGMVN